MEELLAQTSFKRLKTTNWIILIFSSSLFFFSIPTYSIFPEIPSDSPLIERNLEENITKIDNCISAITSIEFIDYIGMTLNYSEYNLIGVYRPYYKYEHSKILSNGQTDYKYTNNSQEEGYNTREITDRNKKLYFFGDRIIKAKKTKFIPNLHYNYSSHSCINGYKSCGKVESQNFRLFCVPENDECPIKDLRNYKTQYFSFNSTQTQFTQYVYNNSYIHYIQYNENDTIRELHLFLALTPKLNPLQDLFSWRIPEVPLLNNALDLITYEFQKLKNQNNITEAYNTYNGTSCLYTYKINLSEYTNLTCLLQDYSDIPDPPNPPNPPNPPGNSTNNTNSTDQNPNNSNSNNINSNNINSGNNNGISYNGNVIKDVQFGYNDINLVDFRNKMKNKFETGLLLSIIFNVICIIFIVIEIFFLNNINFEDTMMIFYIFTFLKIFHFIFNFILFTYEIFLLEKYKFKIEKILFIPYNKIIHGIYLILCLIILFLDILAFYYLFCLLKFFKGLKSKYVEDKQQQSITQNQNSSSERTNNESEFKLNQKESNDIVVPSAAEFNTISPTVITVKKKD